LIWMVLPVAARLFGTPADYLHKDFLDITYMPPNTLSFGHSIQDPGARALLLISLEPSRTDTRPTSFFRVFSLKLKKKNKK